MSYDFNNESLYINNSTNNPSWYLIAFNTALQSCYQNSQKKQQVAIPIQVWFLVLIISQAALPKAGDMFSSPFSYRDNDASLLND